MVTLEAVRQVTIVALVVAGLFFLTVGTIGLLRLPNVYNRMHATSKPTTLGTAAMFLAGFVQFGPGGAGLTSLVGIVFLFLTVPTGAHMISRAAQKIGVPFLGGVTWPRRDDRERLPAAGRSRDEYGPIEESRGSAVEDAAAEGAVADAYSHEDDEDAGTEETDNNRGGDSESESS